jgi:hypothetical protein
LIDLLSGALRDSLPMTRCFQPGRKWSVNYDFWYFRLSGRKAILPLSLGQENVAEERRISHRGSRVELANAFSSVISVTSVMANVPLLYGLI